MLGDSTLITSCLIEDAVLENLNARLEPVERARDVALRALLEEKLYFYQIYERWHENYYVIRSHTFARLPYPLQIVLGHLAYRDRWKTLYGQGTARFSAEEIASFRQEIWTSVNALLVDSFRRRRRRSPQRDEHGKDGKEEERREEEKEPFWALGGDAPTEADATLFGFVMSAFVCDAAPVTRELVKSYPVIMEYAKRIHNRYFPDYAWKG